MRGTTTPLNRGPFSLTIPDTAGPLSIPADGTGGSLSEDLLAWIINVDVFMTPVTETNWNSPAATVAHVYNGQMASSGAQNDEIGWDIMLPAGTWTFELIHAKSTDRGIYTVALDGSSVGTIDGYNNPSLVNQRSQITGIVAATSEQVRLTLTMATKNASSSAYFGGINHLQFKRTA